MELKGLKALFLGDSITEGHGASSQDKVWWRVLGDRAGMETVGYGVGGTRIARQTQPSECARWDEDFNARAERMDRQADIVCVFGGTNDFGHGSAPIGTPSDTDVYTFYGALNHLYTYLQTTYPDAFIFVMTPLHRTNEDDLHQPDMLPLRSYVDIIREMAEKYSLPVLDLWAESGINPNNPVMKERFMPDGLHPNDAGYARLADVAEAFLRSHGRA